MHFLRGNVIMGYIKDAELVMVRTYLTDLNTHKTRLAELGAKLLNRLFKCSKETDPAVYYLSRDAIIEKLCVMPLLHDGNVKLKDDGEDELGAITTKLELQDYVNWSDIFHVEGMPEFNSLVRGANLKAIVTSPRTNELAKFCALLSTIININPRSVSAMIDAEMPIGFSIDFYKKEVLQAYDVIYTKPQSVGMIVTPKPIEVTTLAGGDKNCKFATEVQTVNNMFGSAGICLSAAYPNPNANDLSMASDSKKPRIALDFITRSKYGTLAKMLNEYTKEMSDNFRYDDFPKDITTALRSYEKDRAEGIRLSNTGLESAYVGVLRPTRRPTVDSIPYMGIPRHEAYDPSDRKGGFVQFYSSAERTMNPYMSVFGALYNQIFSPSGTVITYDRGANMNLITLNMSAGHKVCDTTVLLEQAFDLNSADLSTLDDDHSNAMSNFIKGDDRGQQVNLCYVGGSFQSIGSELSKLHTSARLGYSVPYTTYTCTKTFQIATKNANDIVNNEGLNAYARMSPYRVTMRQITLPRLNPVNTVY
jgi:hypothetical protein